VTSLPLCCVFLRNESEEAKEKEQREDVEWFVDPCLLPTSVDDKTRFSTPIISHFLIINFITILC